MKQSTILLTLFVGLLMICACDNKDTPVDAGAELDAGEEFDAGELDAGELDAGEGSTTPDAAALDAGVADSGPNACPAPVPITLVRSGSVGFRDETLTEGCDDLFRLELSERSFVAIFANTTAFTAGISVETESGEAVISESEFLTVRLDAGTYIIRVSGGSGEYQFRAESRVSDCEPDGRLEHDVLFTGRLNATDCEALSTYSLGDVTSRADVWVVEVEVAGFHRFDVTNVAGGTANFEMAVHEDRTSTVPGGADTDIAVNSDHVGTDPGIIVDLEPGTYRVVVASRTFFDGQYHLSFTRAASPSCVENASELRRNPPFAERDVNTWSCGDHVDYPLFLTAAQSVTAIAGSTSFLTMQLLRNDEDGTRVIDSCFIGPTCSITETLLPGITWVRLSGGPGTFDISID